ncbi:MAG TPA: 3-oxoacyl-[acyl-carrier-protein] synthase III C-terminal domain-containing protein [Alphaproteobacteria bacterium]|nr:3-oxoacyl-[acyl-carrier-protein] synthase III C-terminal domain-containing protein [Alphaproteobacteria bacterium]
MDSPPRLMAIATAVPPIEIKQAEIKARAEAFFNTKGFAMRHMLPVFDNAGVERRFFSVSLDWLVEPHGWAERNEIYKVQALDLLESMTRELLQKSGLTIDEIDAIVVASSTGVVTPSLDALLMERMGTRRDVKRLPIFGLGCAGGVIGLSRAAAMATAAPGSRVLFLVVELGALTFRPGDYSQGNVVATALFGDGAAGAILSTAGHGPALGAGGEHTWAQSLHVMGWSVEDDSLGVIFSREIPTLVRERFRPALDKFLSDNRLRFDSIDSFVCHPGGAKVVAALEESFGMQTGTLRDCRDVLREYGNMSAATVMFVLKRVLDRAPRGRYLLSALGPGFTAAFQIVEG